MAGEMDDIERDGIAQCLFSRYPKGAGEDGGLPRGGDRILCQLGKHCPIRKLKRRMQIILLAFATSYVAIQAIDTVRTQAAQLSEALTDRESLIAHLNGASMREEQERPNGTRVYTNARVEEIKVRPLIVGMK